MTTELKPCPFCGGEAEIERRGTARQSMIIACSTCGARMESGDVVGLTAIESWSWNTRSVEDDLRAENEMLQEELADARSNVVAFCGPWAVQHASEHGLPAGHIFAEHYDILEKAGARMDSFTRMDSAARAAIAQEGE